MCAPLVDGLAIFVGSLVLHVAVWRVHRPVSYRVWLPMLIVIFGPVAGVLAWAIAPTPLQAAAALVLTGCER